MKQAKPTIFYPERCEFFVDTNNLIHIQMFETIISKFDDKTINRLNEVINGIKFYVGGKQWHINEKGYIKYPTFEFNFHERTVLIYLYKIFNLGYRRWRNMRYGALRRFIWESFCHEIIMTLIHIIKLNLNLADLAKEYFLNEETDFNNKLISKVFGHEANFPLRVNFIAINNSLWHEPIPELGFLDILYRRKINQIKHSYNAPGSSMFNRIKLYNELRKQKLKYEYEYNISELVNYCIHNDHFEILFRNNRGLHNKFQREFYYKAKRLILKFFKIYDITHELKEYKDSANRTHYFLSHKTFERVKSPCRQICLSRVKNQMLMEYLRFKDFYSECPICKQRNVNQINCEKFYFSRKFHQFKGILLEKMDNFETLDDLNSETIYFGIPCAKCYKIVRNIQGKFSELNQVQNFLINYSNCPICGTKNHSTYLLSFYYDDSKSYLRNHLIELMHMENVQNFKLNYGIPCCDCFTKVFCEQPNYNNINSMF